MLKERKTWSGHKWKDRKGSIGVMCIDPGYIDFTRPKVWTDKQRIEYIKRRYKDHKSLMGK